MYVQIIAIYGLIGANYAAQLDCLALRNQRSKLSALPSLLQAHSKKVLLFSLPQVVTSLLSCAGSLVLFCATVSITASFVDHRSIWRCIPQLPIRASSVDFGPGLPLEASSTQPSKSPRRGEAVSVLRTAVHS